jgi:hypothetical protein
VLRILAAVALRLYTQTIPPDWNKLSGRGAESISKNQGRDGEYHNSGAKGYFTFFLGQRFDQARRLSPRVLQDAIESKEMNPSTEIHLLLDVFEQLSNPRRI